MKSIFKECALWIILLALLMSLLQTEQLSYYYNTLSLFRIYVWISIAVILIGGFLLSRMLARKESFIPFVIQKFKSLSIPQGAKVLIVIVLFGNLVAIGLGKSWYPFYDVGMFRWSSPFQNTNKVLSQLKYYYWKNGEYKILDLRKEGSTILAEHFGWGYTEEFMFSSRFRYRGEKKNFEFLSAMMKERGIDTLWAGVQTVNFETREVSFDPDICNAVKLNHSIKQYYGPLYIPDYQVKNCNEN